MAVVGWLDIANGVYVTDDGVAPLSLPEPDEVEAFLTTLEPGTLDIDFDEFD